MRDLRGGDDISASNVEGISQIEAWQGVILLMD